MERKVYDFFEGEAMPEDCVRKIETQMAHHPKPMIQWRRFAAAAAVLVLMLAVFNADSICAQADSILDEIANALKPEVAQELDKDVGKVEDDVINGYSHLQSSNNGASVSWGGGNFVTVKDGRLYFTGNGEHIDITDLCSMEEAYIYPLYSGNGTIHYLCVGGTPDNYGYYEFVYDLNDGEYPWKTGAGFNPKDPSKDWAPYGWCVDVKETLDHPFFIGPDPTPVEPD